MRRIIVAVLCVMLSVSLFGCECSHKEVKREVTNEDFVEATYVLTETCEACGEVVTKEQKTRDSYVEGSSFILSPADLAARMNGLCEKYDSNIVADLMSFKCLLADERVFGYGLDFDQSSDLYLYFCEDVEGFKVPMGGGAWFEKNGEGLNDPEDIGMKEFDRILYIFQGYDGDESSEEFSKTLTLLISAIDPDVTEEDIRYIDSELGARRIAELNGIEYEASFEKDTIIINIRA